MCASAMERQAIVTVTGHNFFIQPLTTTKMYDLKQQGNFKSTTKSLRNIANS